MSIQYLADLNSQPSDYESPPLTTRPGLPPHFNRLHLLKKFSGQVEAQIPNFDSKRSIVTAMHGHR